MKKSFGLLVGLVCLFSNAWAQEIPGCKIGIYVTDPWLRSFYVPALEAKGFVIDKNDTSSVPHVFLAYDYRRYEDVEGRTTCHEYQIYGVHTWFSQFSSGPSKTLWTNVEDVQKLQVSSCPELWPNIPRSGLSMGDIENEVRKSARRLPSCVDGFLVIKHKGHPGQY